MAKVDNALEQLYFLRMKNFMFFHECENSGCINNLPCIVALGTRISKEVLLYRCHNPNRQKNFLIQGIYS